MPNGEDPFKEFGGQEDTGGDPFAEFGGESLKKKRKCIFWERCKAAWRAFWEAGAAEED